MSLVFTQIEDLIITTKERLKNINFLFLFLSQAQTCEFQNLSWCPGKNNWRPLPQRLDLTINKVNWLQMLQKLFSTCTAPYFVYFMRSSSSQIFGHNYKELNDKESTNPFISLSPPPLKHLWIITASTPLSKCPNEPYKCKNGNDKIISSGTVNINYLYFRSHCIAKIKRCNYIYHFPWGICSVSRNSIDKMQNIWERID